MNTGSCLAFCQTRTHETAMSMISVWDIGLGDAVMGVTRRRDGFRHSSDERSKRVLWRFATATGKKYRREVRTISAAARWLRRFSLLPGQYPWRFAAMPDHCFHSGILLVFGAGLIRVDQPWATSTGCGKSK